MSHLPRQLLLLHRRSLTCLIQISLDYIFLNFRLKVGGSSLEMNRDDSPDYSAPRDRRFTPPSPDYSAPRDRRFTPPSPDYSAPRDRRLIPPSPAPDYTAPTERRFSSRDSPDYCSSSERRSRSPGTSRRWSRTRSRSPVRYERSQSPARGVTHWSGLSPEDEETLRSLYCRRCSVRQHDQDSMLAHIRGKPHLAQLKRLQDRLVDWL